MSSSGQVKNRVAEARNASVCRAGGLSLTKGSLVLFSTGITVHTVQRGGR